jgi:hypothetical protein
MVCDKIVDCLNAEDELNCKNHKSRTANSTSRADEEEEMRPTGDREDVMAKYYPDQKVQNAFHTLQDAGLLKNISSTSGLVQPFFFLQNIKSNDTKVVKALKDLNETGIAKEPNLFNVTRVLNMGKDDDKIAPSE